MSDINNEKVIHIEIYDPPMCCSSGICGPEIDSAVLDINDAIIKINKEFNVRVKIERYLLNQQGPKFMQTPEVLDRLKASGAEILPITLVDGKFVKESEYPSYEELKSYLNV